jgi:chloramphenicol 3-O-phosphotransferase
VGGYALGGRPGRDATATASAGPAGSPTSVYPHGEIDIAVGTTDIRPDEYARMIVQRLDAVVLPKAFDRLRRRLLPYSAMRVL